MVDREDVVMNNEEGMANNEIINNEEVNNEEVNNEEVKEDGKAVKFIKRLLAATIDQIVAIALALLLLLVFDFLLKFAGFYIAQRQPMFLIIYVITNILYSTICESTKLGRTIGKKTMLK
ncbi:RDD family protein [Clostridium sp. DSM 100503]|uniref:RDD family protein n=1 Tax=Clostridium sp. DSM 100503 TaxID=2963282 RepID=UPI00214A0F8C|nr:RDD family protein [Clostridium sp. DSM 100503]MCR1951851.1 RDD family protein [Clostridium sp. DSM 100503]